MKFKDVTKQVIELCENPDHDFQKKGELIEHTLDDCDTKDIIDRLDYAGIIPECYGHDSTEEKVFAKYCDALLARALCELGLNACMIQERADAADVEAKGEGYSVVGDAKAFRLSRTAKNQKDFKVEALNQWRKDANYACLVGPLNQYPSKKSQIYQQAIRYNVVILSYTHLAYMLKNKVKKPDDLKRLWEVTKDLKVSKSAEQYWTAVNTLICEITNTTEDDWRKELKEAAKRLPEQGQEQIDYWEGVIEEIKRMPKETLIKKVIEAMKINAKINVIRKTARIQKAPEGTGQNELSLK